MVEQARCLFDSSPFERGYANVPDSHIELRRGLPRWSRIAIISFLLIIIGRETGKIAADLYDEFARLPGDSSTVVVVEWPIIQLPTVQPAATAHLTEWDEVIGVEEGGQSRAYAVRALSSVSQHVVNDQIAGVPITVTYCGRTHCAEVFTDSETKGPLNIGVGGYDGRPGGGLLLRVGNDRYDQKIGKPLHKPWSFRAAHPFPFAVHHFVRMSWKQWREQHPGTDVYDGQQRAELHVALP